MINAALIGVAGYGEFYLSQLLRLQREGRTKLAAATVINPGKTQKQVAQLADAGCEIFSTSAEMHEAYRGRIDLCCIPAGIPSHAPLTVEALEAGCHVLVEKPAAATMQDIGRMKEAEKKAGKKVMVGFQHIFSEDVQQLKKYILDGKIGDVQSVKMMGMWPRDARYFMRNNWTGKLTTKDGWALDSPACNAFAHDLNIILFLLGNEFENSAKINSVHAELYRANDIESVDTCAVRLITATGIPVHFYMTHACEKKIEPVVKITGSACSVIWTHTDFAIYQNDETVEKGMARSEQWFRENMFNKVIDKLNGKDVFTCGLDVAGAHTCCINAMHTASKIHPIPAEHLQIKAGRVSIKNIENIFQEAFTSGKLPGEMPVSWSKKSEVLNCNGIKNFQNFA